MSMKKNILPKAVFIIFSAYAIFLASQFPSDKVLGFRGLYYGSSLFPIFTLSLLILFSLISITKDILKHSKDDTEHNSEFPPLLTFKILGLWLSGLAFAFLWNSFGFLLPALIFVSVISFIVGMRSFKGYIINLCVTSLIWVIFEKLLNISLSF